MEWNGIEWDRRKYNFNVLQDVFKPKEEKSEYILNKSTLDSYANVRRMETIARFFAQLKRQTMNNLEKSVCKFKLC